MYTHTSLRILPETYKGHKEKTETGEQIRDLFFFHSFHSHRNSTHHLKIYQEFQVPKMEES